MDSIDFTVYCSHPAHYRSPATYKIAAEWSGGDNSELKTFGFANDSCVTEVFQSALERVKDFRASDTEKLGPLQIYWLDTARHDYELMRAPDVEEKVRRELKGNS